MKKERSYLLLQFETKNLSGKKGRATVKIFENATLDQINEKFAKLMGKDLYLDGISQYAPTPYELQVATWKAAIRDDETTLGLEAFIEEKYGHHNEE